MKHLGLPVLLESFPKKEGHTGPKPALLKGQLISKCLIGSIVSTKKPTNFFKNFGPRGQIKKIKALYYTN